MAKKRALVQPPPAKPKPSKPADLDAVLQQLGNDRPYTLVGTASDHWIVHFLGDDQISMIKAIDGKWAIIKSNYREV